MFNKLGLFLVSALALFSSAIYAHEDRNVAALNGYYLDSSLCLAAAEHAGEKYGVSYDLLQTISAVESGKWSDLHNTYIAWPWTINVNGKGYYFESKEEAVEAVKKFQAKGYKSIDVGCMQINLKYHGDAFSFVTVVIGRRPPRDIIRQMLKRGIFMPSVWKSVLTCIRT